MRRARAAERVLKEYDDRAYDEPWRPAAFCATSKVKRTSAASVCRSASRRPAARGGRRSQAAHGETAMISEERYESYDLECDLVRKPGEGEGLVIEIS